MAPIFFSVSESVPFFPNQNQSPLVGLMVERSIPKVVDLPLPLGPRSPYTLPFSTSNEMLLTTTLLNFLVRFLTDKTFSM